jgi:uncharacterized protein YeeX (DUF496 family)
MATLIVATITNAKVKKQTDLRQEMKDCEERVHQETKEIKLDNCKNYLVQAIVKAEATGLAPIEKERYWENYDLYCKNGGNSYIHTETERLKKEGKI